MIEYRVLSAYMLAHSPAPYNVVFAIIGNPQGELRDWELRGGYGRYSARVGLSGSSITFEHSIDYYLYIFD